MSSDYKTLIVIYVLLGIIILPITVMDFIKNRRINGISIVRLMFLLIYSVVPIATFVAISNGQLAYKMGALDTSEIGIERLYLMAGFSIVGYISLEVGYRTYFRFRFGKPTDNRRNSDDELFEKMNLSAYNLSRAAWVMLLISIFSLLLWARGFGGVARVMEYGRIYRSGNTIEGVSNSFGFMKHFVPLSMFSSLVFLALLRSEKKAIFIFGLIPSLLVSIIYSVSNDGRAPFMMYLVSILVLWSMANPSNTKKKSDKVWMALVVIVGYFLISNMDNILSLLRTGVYGSAKTDSGVLSFFADEFCFTVRNAQCSQEALQDGETFRIGKDILSAIFSIVPSRFTPNWIQRLEIVNTQYWKAGMIYYGGKPTDIMSAGLYELWYFGIIIWPFLYGVVVKRTDIYIDRIKVSIYGKILFAQLIYQFAKTVAYADLALITLNIFYIVIGHLIVKFFCRRLA